MSDVTFFNMQYKIFITFTTAFCMCVNFKTSPEKNPERTTV